MEKKVLVPLDDSEGAEEAFELTLEEFSDAHVTLLHVADPKSSDSIQVTEGTIPFDEETREEIIEESTRFLDDYAQKADKEGVEVTKEYRIGEPSEEIVGYAKDEDIDHIVMGSHGRSGFKRVLLGSVAESVARRSPVPVTVVR